MFYASYEGDLIYLWPINWRSINLDVVYYSTLRSFSCFGVALFFWAHHSNDWCTSTILQYKKHSALIFFILQVPSSYMLNLFSILCFNRLDWSERSHLEQPRTGCFKFNYFHSWWYVLTILPPFILSFIYHYMCLPPLWHQYFIQFGHYTVCTE